MPARFVSKTFDVDRTDLITLSQSVYADLGDARVRARVRVRAKHVGDQASK